ncbi:Hypothetical protein NAEGRDRAFT_56935 [Naegleria gruberi]|uniref:Uncharacterized protein n=1 Tax=Naegleria gruberi TaxID=5762 RepID=D2V2P4_NAEGR|nr:uncharacterized protein NAEGRDRAFT_56935 [Naegleria gruberi]EFC49098.1 Hypothetical protein NAEGRDRAFT_56935 [Naegleria gruberi]|eukprot:XP_002681842.1 Hypothetical protein NAEGRDRAFT_56935 [Naegleria gruberi strain NEG-M]
MTTLAKRSTSNLLFYNGKYIFIMLILLVFALCMQLSTIEGNNKAASSSSETFLSALSDSTPFLDSFADLIRWDGGEMYKTNQQSTTSSDGTSSADYNVGNSDTGYTIFGSTSMCAKCYAANFSTAEETFPPKLINGKPYLRNQFVNSNQTFGDVLTFILATHHAEQKYAPRENLKEISVELRSPSGSTIDLVLSNNLDEFYNNNGDKIFQNWYVRVYNNIKVRRIISHGKTYAHTVSVNFYYDGAVMPEIIYMCNSSSTCQYPSITATAYDYESGGRELVSYLKRVGLISDFTSYMSCSTSKAFQIRDVNTGTCYYEVKKVAVLFIAIIYGIVGFCLLGGVCCVILFVISACWLCKKDFQDPEFL